MRNMLKLMIGALIATCAAPAMAGVLMFDSGGTKSGDGREFTNGEVTAHVSAWSSHSLFGVNSASLGSWSEGLGVINGMFDNSHTVDNNVSFLDGFDFLLLEFDQEISLDKAGFATGWHGMNDTDATIGYGTLTQPITSLAGFTFYESWGRGKSGDDVRTINPEGFVGNTWIIGASSSSKRDKYADGFKLSGVSYNVVTPAVPEPSTWLMLILGFGFVGGMLRFVRRQGQLSLA